MSRNEKETKIINRAIAAVRKYETADLREGGTYFPSTCVAAFQKIAVDAAALITEQGAADSDPRLVKIGERVKALGKVGYGHANSLGFAFRKALGKEARENPNPFKGMQL